MDNIAESLATLKPLAKIVDRQTFVSICARVAEMVAGAVYDRVNPPQQG
jgi:hypothetical protein